jgi:hypothetical protein
VLAERRPGEVMAAGLERIRRSLSSLHGDQVLADQSRRIMNFYHEIVLLPALATTPNVHTRRKMETLSAAIDCLVEGNPDRCGDLLLGRYKALEEACSESHWDVARELEVLPQKTIGIATDEERQRAAMIRARTLRLQQAVQGSGGQAPPGNRGGGRER